MESTQDEAKHAHLLQPIRDLAANWEINIASELEDYLEVLESVTFTIEGNNEVNFAEAALLVQGSAHVYSKKVEYLHQMVYQALDVIGDKTKAKVKGSEGKAAGASEQADFDDEEMFLCLDDVLQTGQDIDLDEFGSPKLQRPLRPPSVLLALDNPVAGYCSSANGVSFGIANCTIHESGALLLEEGDGATLDCMLRRRTAVRTSPSGAFHAPPQQFGCGVPTGGSPCAAPSPVTEDQDMGIPDAYDGGDDDDCGDAQPWDDDGINTGDAMQAARCQESEPAETVVDEEEFDPWEPLDMYDSGNMASKPFRRAKRLPKFRAAGKAATVSIGGSAAAAAVGLTGPAPAPPAPSRLVFAEFASALQRVQAAARADSRSSTAPWPARRSAFRAELLEDTHPNNCDADLAGWDDDDGGGGGGPTGGLSDDEDYLTVPEAVDSGPSWENSMGGGDGGAGSPSAPSYEQLCRAHVDAFMSAAAAADVQSDLAKRVSEWRTRIQPVVEDQDARESFDMEVYGERILARLKALTVNGIPAASAPLCHAIQDHHKWQVSRLFAASLQLMNNGNLNLNRSEQVEMTELTVDIKCLSFAEKRTGYPLTAVSRPTPKGSRQAAPGRENRQISNRRRIAV